MRDPRQALLSWVHHLDKTGDPFFYSELPKDYCKYSFSRKIDIQIETHFKKLIKWIDDWIDIESNDNYNFRILFTNYEDFIEFPNNFFDSILDFYDIDKSTFIYPVQNKKRDFKHFRKGEKNEWLQVFNKSQKEITTDMITERMKDKFSWNKKI